MAEFERRRGCTGAAHTAPGVRLDPAGHPRRPQACAARRCVSRRGDALMYALSGCFDAHQRARSCGPMHTAGFVPMPRAFLWQARTRNRLSRACTCRDQVQPKPAARACGQRQRERTLDRWGGGESYDARLASSDKPPWLGPAAMHAIMMRAAKRLIRLTAQKMAFVTCLDETRAWWRYRRLMGRMFLVQTRRHRPICLPMIERRGKCGYFVGEVSDNTEY